MIRHLWISQHGPTRTKDLFDKIKQDIKSKQSAIDLSSELAVNAVNYAAILNPAHEMWNPYGPSAKKYIETLRALGIEQIRPLLLSAIKKFGNSSDWPIGAAVRRPVDGCGDRQSRRNDRPGC